MPQEKSVLDEVLVQLAASPPQLRWFHRVAPEHMDDIEELRRAWLDGRLGKKRRTAARAISKILQARGIATVGVQGIEEWLARA